VDLLVACGLYALLTGRNMLESSEPGVSLRVRVSDGAVTCGGGGFCTLSKEYCPDFEVSPDIVAAEPISLERFWQVK
jgi:hypothetical protein